MFVVEYSANKGTVRAFPQDQAAGKPVVDGAFTGRQADTEAIDHEIIAAQNGHKSQKTTSAEAQTGSPEIYRLAGSVGYIDAQEALAQSGMPVRAFRKRKVEPTLDRKKTKTSEKKSGSGLSECLVKRRSSAMIEEGIRDSRCSSKERNKNRERDHKKNQIDDCRDTANPETCVRQRCSRGGVVACSFHFLSLSPFSYSDYSQLPVLFHARDLNIIL